MKKILLSEVVKAVDGEFIGDKTLLSRYIYDVVTDSRVQCPQALFIPLKGINFDAHDFINQAMSNGALCALSERHLSSPLAFIKVKSTSVALMNLAEYYRSLFEVKVVAITGSNGKTTTKDMITCVLNEKFNVVSTKGNFNNQIGLPMTVFNLNDETEVIVVEMGMNHFGEISSLSKIVRPDVCVITNIGVSHIENLGSQNGILKAKCEIFEYATNECLAVLNGDDKLLKGLQCPYRIVYYGIDETNDCSVKEIDYDNSRYVTNKGITVRLECCCGEHMIQNSLAAVAVGEHFGLSAQDISNGLKNFKSSSMRMEIIQANEITIINDAYNSSPDSVKAAVNTLEGMQVLGRRICILGDMLELGDDAQNFHYQLGVYIAKKKLDMVVCVGKLARDLHDGLVNSNPNDSMQIMYYASKNEIPFEKLFMKNDTVLIKASRAMKFETVVKILMR